MARRIRILTASFGLLSVSVFVCSFAFFAFLHPDFDILRDFISKLGSKGQPCALWWNIFGFAVVGILLAAFGWLFGLCRNDRILGACLVLAGFGFALTAIPTDFADTESALSAAHFVSICLSLAGYCLGLSRLTGSGSPDHDRIPATWVIILAILPILCVAGEVFSEPVAHRIVLCVVFAWVILISLRLLRLDTTAEVVG